MLRLLIIAACLVMLRTAAEAQITVEPNVQVSRALETRAHDEVMIASDPVNPRRLIACSHVEPGPGSKQGIHTIAYLSDDSGLSWRPVVEDSAPPGLGYWTRQSWDPTCAYGEQDAVYFGMGMRTNDNDDDARARLYRSTDGGRTWHPPELIDAGYLDKPLLVVDAQEHSPYREKLYLAYINRAPRPGGLSVASSSTGGEGMDTVVSVSVGDSVTPRINVAPSPMGGVVLSDGTLVLLVHSPEPAVVVSRDGGRTFAVRRVAEPGTAGHVSVGPSIAVDRSGGVFQNRVYVAWTLRLDGRDQIAVSWSEDRGLTWSPPRVVNDDRVAAAGNGPDHMLPAIAVNREGVVGVSWYDRREQPDNLGWSVRFSASLDGGVSWLPNVRVSEQPHRIINVMQDPRPRPIGPVSFEGEVSRVLEPRNAGAGHYAGSTASADGRFHPVWIDNRTGVPQVWTAAVRVAGRAALHGDGALSQYRDVTTQVTLHMYSMTFTRKSPTTATVAGELYVENTSNDTLRAPLLMRFHRVTAPAARVDLAGARTSAAGSLLNLGPALQASGSVLVPGSHVGPLPIRFELTEIKSTDPESSDLGIKLEGMVLTEPAASAAGATTGVVSARVAGIDVIVYPTENDTLEIMGTILAGDAWSPSHNPALGSIVAGMLGAGTTSRDKDAFAAALAETGAELGFDLNGHSSLGWRGQTGREVVEIRGRSPNATFPRVMALLADALRSPGFAAEELLALKRRIAPLRKSRFETPTNHVSRVFARAFYPDGHPNAWPTLEAFYVGIDRTSVTDLRTFHAAHYGPSRTTLIVVGNVAPAEVHAAVGANFAGWKDAPSSARPAPHLRRLTTRDTVVAMPDAVDLVEGWPQVVMRLGQATTLRYTDPDALALRAATVILDDRLRTIVTDTTRGAIARAQVSSSTPRDLTWSVIGYFTPWDIDTGLSAIRRELDRWWSTGLTAEELAQAKRQLANTYTNYLSPGVMMLYVAQQGYPPTWPAQGYSQALAALTLEQVNGAIRRHLNPGTMMLAVAGAVGHPGPPKPYTLTKMLRATIDSAGVDAAVERYQSLKATDFADHYVGELSLNDLGYAYVDQDNLAAALAVFQIAVDQFPESSNAHDSLAETYMKSGQRELARTHYQRSLELDPGNDNAGKMLALLQAPP